MEVYTSEHDQVDALKRWWDKNGRAVLIGVAVAIALILVWRGWKDYRDQHAAEASAAYAQMLETADPAKVQELGRALLSSYGDSAYAALASLAMARAAVEQQDMDAAAAHLRAAMDNAKIAGMRQVAAVRLAQVQLAQGKHDDALKTLDGLEADGLRGAVEEAKGDVYLARGDKAAARQAYQNALAEYADSPAKQHLIAMKLDDLAGEGKE